MRGSGPLSIRVTRERDGSSRNLERNHSRARSMALSPSAPSASIDAEPSTTTTWCGTSPENGVGPANASAASSAASVSSQKLGLVRRGCRVRPADGTSPTSSHRNSAATGFVS
ncbi:MAG: hypothetical protein R3F34_01820 [Planctomycetota bacterium]